MQGKLYFFIFYNQSQALTHARQQLYRELHTREFQKNLMILQVPLCCRLHGVKTPPDTAVIVAFNLF
jgi:hypothetical protein